MPKKYDLTDMKFGKLKSIRLSERKDKANNNYWLCQCECGKLTEVTTAHLINGNTTSCGCGIIKDLKGKTFGQLTVLYLTDKRKKTNAVWHCKCECGEEIDVSSVNLTKGDTKSCGKCAYRERQLRDNQFEYAEKTSISKARKIKDGTLKINSNNTSGATGVYWLKRENKWRAEIIFQGKTINLGYFDKDKKEDAIKIRKQAEIEIVGNFLEWYDKLKEKK